MVGKILLLLKTEVWWMCQYSNSRCLWNATNIISSGFLSEYSFIYHLLSFCISISLIPLSKTFSMIVIKGSRILYDMFGYDIWKFSVYFWWFDFVIYLAIERDHTLHLNFFGANFLYFIAKTNWEDRQWGFRAYGGWFWRIKNTASALHL